MRTVKFIIVGSGNMAKTYSDIISKNPITKLLAIVGNKSGRENELAKLYDARPYSNCDLIQAINDNPDVESIIVATSEWIRKDIINIALSAGKHVLYEKPLAVSYEEASEISKLFKLSKNNSIIMPVFNLRFNSQNDALKNHISQNKIGKIRLIHSRRNGNSTIFKRIINNMSPFFWLTPHEVDLIRWITNSEVKYVEANLIYFNKSLEGYLSSKMRLSNDIDAHHFVSWCTPPLSNLAPNTFFEVFGSEGIASSNEHSNFGLFYNPENKVHFPDIRYSPTVNNNKIGPFKLLFEHFLDCILNNKEPIISNHDALEAVKICSAMELSNKFKKRVYLKDL